MDIRTALTNRQVRDAESESMYMAPTIQSGVIDVRGGEFRADINFPMPFDHEPVVTFGFVAGPGTSYTSTRFPNWSAAVVGWRLKPLNSIGHVSEIVLGCQIAGLLLYGLDWRQDVSRLRGELAWTAVGKAFSGGL